MMRIFYDFAFRLIRDVRNRTRKITNRIWAIPAAAPAIPTNPSTPARMAMIKNTTVHCNITFLSFAIHNLVLIEAHPGLPVWFCNCHAGKLFRGNR